MSYSTGNLKRDEYIVRAIRFLATHGQEITLANVSARLDPAFELDETELTGILANETGETVEPAPRARGRLGGSMPDPMDYTPAPKRQENFEAPRAPQPEPPHNPPTNTTPRPATMSYDAAHAAVIAARQVIADLRLVANARARDTAAARRKLMEAVQAYIAGADGLTRAQREQKALRDYADASQKERAARVAAGGPGTSRSARAFVQKRMVSGPSRSGVSEAGRARTGFVVPGSPAAIAQAIARQTKPNA